MIVATILLLRKGSQFSKWAKAILVITIGLTIIGLILQNVLTNTISYYTNFPTALQFFGFDTTSQQEKEDWDIFWKDFWNQGDLRTDIEILRDDFNENHST